jgi:hypothetical protein
MSDNSKPTSVLCTFFHFPENPFKGKIVMLPEPPSFEEIKELYSNYKKEKGDDNLSIYPFSEYIFGKGSEIWFLENGKLLDLDPNCLFRDVLLESAKTLRKLNKNENESEKNVEKRNDKSENIVSLCFHWLKISFPVGTVSICVKDKEMAKIITDLVEKRLLEK